LPRGSFFRPENLKNLPNPITEVTSQEGIFPTFLCSLIAAAKKITPYILTFKSFR
jgi:hypothetical protein